MLGTQDGKQVRAPCPLVVRQLDVDRIGLEPGLHLVRGRQLVGGAGGPITRPLPGQIVLLAGSVEDQSAGQCDGRPGPGCRLTDGSGSNHGDQRNQRRDHRQEVAVIDEHLHHQERKKLRGADQDEKNPIAWYRGGVPPASTNDQQHHERDDGGHLNRLKKRAGKDGRFRAFEDGGEAERRKHVAGKDHSKACEVDQASDRTDDPERGTRNGPSILPSGHPRAE